MKKVIIIIILSAITFVCGSLIVYYNTSNLIYDNVNLFTVFDDGFKIMDFRFVIN